MRIQLRVLLVPTVLMGLGFVVGSLVAGAVGVLWTLAESPAALLSDEEAHAGVMGMAIMGGLLGVFVGTPVVWLLLRHVPVGRALAGSASGTLAGAVLGQLAGGTGMSLVLGFAGFAGVLAWLRVRTPRESLPPAP